MIFLKLLIILISLVGEQYSIGKLTAYIYNKIKKSSDRINDLLEEKKAEINFAGNKYNLEDFHKERTGLYLVSEKKKDLKFITIVISIIEIIGFSLLTFLLIKSTNFKLIEILAILLKIAAGWLALKIVGNYQQWAGIIFGRACFYTFLLASIINIFFGIILGFFSVKIF